MTAEIIPIRPGWQSPLPLGQWVEVRENDGSFEVWTIRRTAHSEGGYFHGTFATQSDALRFALTHRAEMVVSYGPVTS